MRPSRRPVSYLALASLFALGACGRGDDGGQTEDAARPDLGLALAAPMMTDPDLVSRDLAAAAIAGGGAPTVVLPPFERSKEAAQAAIDEAEGLAGGPIEPAPVDGEDIDPAFRDGVVAAQRARAVLGPGNACAGKAEYGLAWSLQLPALLPIYPRGHLIEAAGSNAEGCRLRVVRFVTPVAPDAVIGFYRVRGLTAGADVVHQADDETRQLSGRKGAAAFAVQARRRDDGLTEADIVTSGL